MKPLDTVYAPGEGDTSVNFLLSGRLGLITTPRFFFAASSNIDFLEY